MKNKHAQKLGKLGGLKKSLKKAEASRLNGKKGGRPKALQDTKDGRPIDEDIDKAIERYQTAKEI